MQTDVAVFDKRGRFVEDLKPEQFELQVDGKTQHVIFFERVTTGSRSKESQLAAARRGLAAGKSAETNTTAAAEQPERGCLIFFFLSDGFILNERNGGALETLRGVAQEAARAGAVVYTMDLRENTTSGIRSSVDATTNDYIDLTARRVGVGLGEMTATREPLQLIADQTGGRAIYN